MHKWRRPRRRPKREIARYAIQLEVPIDKKDLIEDIKRRVNLSKKKFRSSANVEWLTAVLDRLDQQQSEFQHQIAPTRSFPTSLLSPPGSTQQSLQDHHSKRKPVQIHTALAEDDGQYLVATTATVGSLLKHVVSNKGRCASCASDIMTSSIRTERRGCTLEESAS